MLEKLKVTEEKTIGLNKSKKEKLKLNAKRKLKLDNELGDDEVGLSHCDSYDEGNICAMVNPQMKTWMHLKLGF